MSAIVSFFGGQEDYRDMHCLVHEHYGLHSSLPIFCSNKSIKQLEKEF